jgi:hypothetical protein
MLACLSIGTTALLSFCLFVCGMSFLCGIIMVAKSVKEKHRGQ